MRNDRPWFPMYGRDFRVACVGAMTLEETGAYSLIITLLYECGGRLPDRDDFIAKQIGTSTRVWRRIREKLVTLGKLCVDGDALTNKRVETELVAAEKLSEARAKAGRAGGLAPRKSKPDGESLDDVSAKFPQSLAETLPKLSANDSANSLILHDLGEAIAKRFSTVTVTDTKEKVEGSSELRSSELVARKRTTTPSVSAAVEAWNVVAQGHGWAVCEKIIPDRRQKITARLREYGADGWAEMLRRATQTKFLIDPSSRGEKHKSWKPNIDWFIRPGTFVKLLERQYEDGPASKPIKALRPEEWVEFVGYFDAGQGWPIDIGPAPNKPDFAGPDELYRGDVEARKAWKKANGLNGFHPEKTSEADLFGGIAL